MSLVGSGVKHRIGQAVRSVREIRLLARSRVASEYRLFARPNRSFEDSRPVPWFYFLARPFVRFLAQVVIGRFGRLVPAGRLTLEDMSHIAVVHWDKLGDAIHLGPVLRELRRNVPLARIVLVSNEQNAGVFANCPYVDQVLLQAVTEVPDPGRAHGESKSSRRLVWDAARLLRNEARTHGKIDLVIGPIWLNPAFGHSYFEGVLFQSGLGGALLRHERSRNGFSEVNTRQHHVPRNLSILSALGASIEDDSLEMWLEPGDRAEADELLRVVPPGTRLVAIATSAGQLRREWPVARFAAVVDDLSSKEALTFVLLGGEEVRAQTGFSSLSGRDGVIDATGMTSLGGLGAVLARADVLISNDSGPAHVAAAVGTPVVVVAAHPRDGDPWMITSPNRYRPWGVSSVVLQPTSAILPCAPGYTCISEEPHCILSVTGDQVLDAVGALLADDQKDGT